MNTNDQRIFTLQLSAQSVQVIYDALQNAPYKFAAAVLNELLPQVAEQEKANGIPQP
jgi:hypothetical protein